MKTLVTLTKEQYALACAIQRFRALGCWAMAEYLEKLLKESL